MEPFVRLPRLKEITLISQLGRVTQAPGTEQIGVLGEIMRVKVWVPQGLAIGNLWGRFDSGKIEVSDSTIERLEIAAARFIFAKL